MKTLTMILMALMSFSLYSQTTFQEKTDSIYEKVDVLPEFKGGQPMLYKFLNETIHYPQDCIDNEIQGKVFVKFIVKKDGKLDNFEVVKSAHPLLDQEALRVFKSMPKWEPAKVNGQNVDSYFIMPLNFQIN
jgi:protein TonB